MTGGKSENRRDPRHEISAGEPSGPPAGAGRLSGEVSQDFMTIYSVIVAFYFGTQMKEEDGRRDKEELNGDA